MKKYILLSMVIIFSALTSSPLYAPPSTAQSEVEDEEYEIYSAIINSVYARDPSMLIIILDETSGYPARKSNADSLKAG
jgi:plasmid maintenance system killer protein